MLWLILAGLVWIGITVFFIYKSHNDSWFDWSDAFLGSVLTLIVSVMFAAALLLFSSVFATAADAHIDYELETDTKMIALKDNSDITGSKFVFSGYVDDDLYYYYATDTELGYKVEKVKASRSYIRYSDNTHIEKYNAVYSNWFVRLITFPEDDRYIIYCPDKTITQAFGINLE